MNQGRYVKRAALALCLAALLIGGSAFADPANGTMFGTLSTAQAVGQGSGNLGFGVGLGDNMTSFFGNFKYGLSRYGTLGLELGAVDPDGPGNDSKLSFGASFAYQVWGLDEPDVKRPFDMDVGGFFEIYPGDGVDYTYFGGFVTGSFPFAMSNGSRLSPYARMNVRSEKISYDAGGSNSSLQFGLNMGAAWEFTKGTTLYGEIQLDGNDGLFLGLDFNVM